MHTADHRSRMSHPRYTAIIIGAGPAGYTCAVRLAQMGAKVAVVERDYIGGICINWGCTPSKAMIESAKIAKMAREAKKYGIGTGPITVDFKTVAARRDKVLTHARDDIAALLKRHDIDIFQGEGHLIDSQTVRVEEGQLDREGTRMNKTGHTFELVADHVVLATGSAPVNLPGIDPKDPTIISSNRLITIDKLPSELTIVGGGVIGLEFATIFAHLGSCVTIVEFNERLLPNMDPEISHELTQQLEATGITLLLGHKIVELKKGHIRAEHVKTGEIEEWDCPCTLVAIGRRAVLNAPEYDALGLQYTDRGITTDDALRTNISSIWAIGDATGKSILAHVGMQQGIVCAENIMAWNGHRKLRTMDYSVIPAIVYTLPEIATVGTVPTDKSVYSVHVPFKNNLRAVLEENDEGFVKIWVKDKQVVAAQAIGFTVSEIIQELANMIALETPIEDVTHIIHAHPTYSEINRTVLEHALGRAIELD